MEDKEPIYMRHINAPQEDAQIFTTPEETERKIYKHANLLRI